MSRDSSTRSAARGTFSALRDRADRPLPRPFQRLPIRWRLAVTSAGLTLIILLAFAIVVGTLTTQRIRDDFNDEVSTTANRLANRVTVGYNPQTRRPECNVARFSGQGAVIRIVTIDGFVICQTPGAPDLGPPLEERRQHDGYRVETRPLTLQVVTQQDPFVVFPGGTRTWLQFARPSENVEETIARVRFLLAVGVLGGAGFALLAGLAVARRAMSPIAELTATAGEIERTRDPSRRVPHPRADDEVAELARTLEGMLAALDASRSETEAMLRRQREFVADASHELRTPLTAILANLEFLADELDGEPEEAAGSALRSARRMRRLVADLLLLARADAGRMARHEPTDIGAVLLDAVAELHPVAGEHDLEVDAGHVRVDGARDELMRLTLNLLENAISHTPPGTRIRAATRAEGPSAVLEVADDGPGVPQSVAPRIFERFVRGGGEKAGSSGLGLAIVRAVAEAHGGTVTLEQPAGDLGGARFVVRLPRTPGDGAPAPGEGAPEALAGGRPAA